MAILTLILASITLPALERYRFIRNTLKTCLLLMILKCLDSMLTLTSLTNVMNPITVLTLFSIFNLVLVEVVVALLLMKSSSPSRRIFWLDFLKYLTEPLERKSSSRKRMDF